MNPHMWKNAATQRNLAQLIADGIAIVGPNAGEMAERHEAGVGRMAEPLEIVAAIEALRGKARTLAGKRVVVTSGPTHEPIDPVRYIANRSSGKQGYAIAAAAAAMGARVTLISGAVTLPTPPGVDRIDVETAQEMADAVKQALPVDVAIMVAAVADWRTKNYAGEKIKTRGSAPPALLLTENPDILAEVGALKKRPFLVGFAAETQDLEKYARAKLERKKLDLIAANCVGAGAGFDACDNELLLLWSGGREQLPRADKRELAHKLIDRISALRASARKRGKR